MVVAVMGLLVNTDRTGRMEDNKESLERHSPQEQRNDDNMSLFGMTGIVPKFLMISTIGNTTSTSSPVSPQIDCETLHQVDVVSHLSVD
jgi:hypothetical protein